MSVADQVGRLARRLADTRPVRWLLSLVDLRMDNRLTARGMLAQAFEFKQFNFVHGDYFEFGLWRGATFRIAHQLKHRFGQTEMLLWGFDSFQGLPASAERKDNFFREGEFACSESELRQILRRSGFKAEEYSLVPGFYDSSLNDALHERLAGRKAAIVYVDCDLYESTVPVLEFLHRYWVNGTIVCFDDYYHFKASPVQGEQRALREYLLRHPEIQFLPYLDYCPTGKSFIVRVD
jgi:O-methyltransferase